MKSTAPKDTRCAVIARVPRALRKQLDAAAKRACRSRSAELEARLADSLRRYAVLPGAAVEQGV